jgi:hypothetical protein
MSVKCDYCGKFRKDEFVEIIEIVCGDGFSVDNYAICNECKDKNEVKMIVHIDLSLPIAFFLYLVSVALIIYLRLAFFR